MPAPLQGGSPVRVVNGACGHWGGLAHPAQPHPELWAPSLLANQVLNRGAGVGGSHPEGIVKGAVDMAGAEQSSHA